jgi:hypothetical protein
MGGVWTTYYIMINDNNGNNNLIEVKIIRDNGEIKLYVRACPEFEEYLKNTRKITKNENFCNTGVTYNFYDGRTDGLSENSEYDSAVRELISYNRLNFAVLRIKGISDGVEIKLNKLVSVEDLNILMRKFIFDFKKFYRDYIKGFEISVIIQNKDILI